MARWFIILPGTRVWISRDGSALEQHMLDEQLNFQQPIEVTDTTATFAQGSRRIVVDRVDVALSEYDGQQGIVQWGL
jgi:hypothetical protein